ncbi:hypothetical protein V3C99_008462 [Haemonchus contortus]
MAHISYERSSPSSMPLSNAPCSRHLFLRTSAKLNGACSKPFSYLIS